MATIADGRRDRERPTHPRQTAQPPDELLDFGELLNFDKVELTQIEVPKHERERALAALDPNVRKGLERARRNLETVSRAQLPAPLDCAAYRASWPRAALIVRHSDSMLQDPDQRDARRRSSGDEIAGQQHHEDTFGGAVLGARLA